MDNPFVLPEGFHPSHEDPVVLPENQARVLFFLNALLGVASPMDGPAVHQLMRECLDASFTSTEDLVEWLSVRIPVQRPSRRAVDRCIEGTDRLLERGAWAAEWKGVPPFDACRPSCPRCMFGVGPPSKDQPRLGVFNSRKSRLVSPDEPWISALRFSLPLLLALRPMFVSSTGTLTCDLVAAYARKMQAPLLLVQPFPLEELAGTTDSAEKPQNPDFCSVFTCFTRAMRCSKRSRMSCRDRLMASLTDIHWILEIRSRGSLVDILSTQQESSPRVQWILEPCHGRDSARGNQLLLNRFPRSTTLIPGRSIIPENPRSALSGRPSFSILECSAGRDEFLYHYTRSCPGAWPGQEHDEYLLSLLNGDPLSAHTALDTLARIIREGKIRGSHRLVRGVQPVVSWTSVSPVLLSSIRQWNRPLMRWTFEPYGIAVSRKLLRKQGAMPSIYIKDALLGRIPAGDRFRFQRHESPGCRWKQEKEWRLRGDFLLGDISEGEGFVFVPNSEEAEGLCRRVITALPVLAISANRQ